MLIKKFKINKKRLIRKAEFVNGFDYRGTKSGMLSLYKNPTGREIEEAIDESRFNSVRGVILENGETYCWNGDILHDSLPYEANVPVNGNVFRFACESNRWIFDLHGDFTFEEGIKAFSEHILELEKFGKLNGSLQFYFASDTGKTFEKLDGVMSAHSDSVTFSGIENLNKALNALEQKRLELE